jgi:tRNA G18 (ribose-2'-O)-methylase SpoU
MPSSDKRLFQTRQCQDESCRFRFPIRAGSLLGDHCPRCGHPTEIAIQLFPGHDIQQADSPTPPTPTIEALLDNIRSAFNVGAIFRTAEAAAITHLHLCGITATPANPRLAKTALGAEDIIPWHYYNNALDAASQLQAKGYRLWAIEGGERAESLFDITAEPGGPILLIVGNELAGVDPDLLALCERVFYIPMYGRKSSLNVEVAFGIAAYYIRENLDRSAMNI